MKEKKHTIIGFRSAGLMGAFITVLVMAIGLGLATIFGLSIDSTASLKVNYPVPEMFRTAGFLNAIPLWSLFLILPLAIFGLVYQGKLFKARRKCREITSLYSEDVEGGGAAFAGGVLSVISGVIAFGPAAQGAFLHVAIAFAIPSIVIFRLMGKFMNYKNFTGFMIGRLPWIAGIVWLAFYWVKGYGIFPILSVWMLIAVLFIVGLAVTSISPMIEAIAETIKPSINQPILKRWSMSSKEERLFKEIEKQPYLYWVVEKEWSI